MDKQPASRTCFLCGKQNDIGLKMTWYNDIEAQQVRATVVVPEHFNSYPGIVHGGIIAALLDETAGRATMIEGDANKFFVTARLDIKYRLPTPTGQLLTVVGWVTKQKRNYAQVAGEIRLADGQVTAQCTALVILPGEEFYERCNWEQEKEYWRVYDD